MLLIQFPQITSPSDKSVSLTKRTWLSSCILSILGIWFSLCRITSLLVPWLEGTRMCAQTDPTLTDTRCSKMARKTGEEVMCLAFTGFMTESPYKTSTAKNILNASAYFWNFESNQLVIISTNLWKWIWKVSTFVIFSLEPSFFKFGINVFLDSIIASLAFGCQMSLYPHTFHTLLWLYFTFGYSFWIELNTELLILDCYTELRVKVLVCGDLSRQHGLF